MSEVSRTPNRYLRTPEAGRFSVYMDGPWKSTAPYGTGPRYRKIGGRVIYS